MKRLALVAAVLAIAACGKKEEAPVDSAAMTPAPAAMTTTDTTVKMDTTMKMDTSAKTADTTVTTTTTKKM